MDLRKTIITQLDRLLASEAVEKHIATALDAAIKRLVQDELSDYGEFGKQLKVAVKSALKIEDHQLDLPSYNQCLLQMIRTQVSAAVETSIESGVRKNLEGLLVSPPKEIRLTDLIESFRDGLHKNSRSQCSCEVLKIGLNIERDTNRFLHLNLDESDKNYGGERKSTRSYQIGIDALEGSVYAIRLGGRQAEKALFAGPYYGFQRVLFQMYCAGTKLIDDGVDEDSLTLTYGGHDD